MLIIRYLLMINLLFLMKSEDDFTKLITEAGYPVEVHRLKTADAYTLSIYRIPHTPPTSKTIVLMHGLASCGAQFVFAGPGLAKPLGFKLADNGYDVWLANTRGIDFTSNHNNQQEREPKAYEKFWKFSWDEIAKYDLPAIIDYVLMKSNQTSIHYVGYSQGTTVVMAMLSTFPQYNKKFKTVHLITPAIYFSNARTSVKSAAMFTDAFEDSLSTVGLVELPLISPESRQRVAHFCSKKPAIELCKQYMFLFIGPSQHLNEAFYTYPIITKVLRFIPSPASIMQFLHYGQLIKSGGDRFLHFDHRQSNMLIYNQSTPPEYQLSNVKTRIHFLYGTTDYVTTYQDVERLIKEFKPWTIGVTKLIGYADFISAKNVDQLANTKILNLMNQYN